MNFSALVASFLIAAPAPLMANPINRFFEECDRYKIVETYVAGSYDRHGRYQEGYVKSRREKLPCRSGSNWSSHSGSTRPKQIKRCSSEGKTLGGLLGGFLAVTYVIKKNNLRWGIFADLVAPLLILGYAIGRVGCLLVGDDYGLPTHLAWGIEFPNGIPPSTYRIFQTQYPWVDLSGFTPGVLKVHPTQIYETLIGLGIFYYLYQKRTSVKVAGSLFFTYLVMAGAERFMIEFLRINQKYLFGLSGAQVISLIMISIGLWFLYYPLDQKQGHATEKK